MAFRVLVTARSFSTASGPHHDFLRHNGCEVDLHAKAHPMSADELGEVIGGYDGAILGLDTCDASVIERADRLRVISRYGSGVDQVDLEAAAQRGIAVTNTPGANKIAVAELAIGLIFALARNIPQVASAARQGTARRTPGWELTGKTLGIVGLGAIGREVAVRGLALGMRVIAHDPFFGGGTPPVPLVDLPTLLRESDVISLHCALTPQTERLIDAARIAQMRDGACVINTARGGLIDEKTLHTALQSGKLLGAAADVLRDDPPPIDHPLLALDNFIYLPHLGATTREAVQRMSMMAAQNLVAVLRGDPCDYVVNAAALKAYQSGKEQA
jgi:D-3-phosphoglycerate dehydrogenase